MNSLKEHPEGNSVGNSQVPIPGWLFPMCSRERISTIFFDKEQPKLITIQHKNNGKFLFSSIHACSCVCHYNGSLVFMMKKGLFAY